jgi:biopolymer transport protein TolQ
MPDAVPLLLSVVAEAAPIGEASILDLLLDADIIVQAVLLILMGMSVACWVIIINKLRAVRVAERESQAFLDAFWKSRRLDAVFEGIDRYRGSPVAMVFKAGYVELSKLTNAGGDAQAAGGVAISGEDNLTRALRRARTVERTELGRLTGFLATTGSTAPFIGLFGTVWGILRAFQKIGISGQANIATVGPDIAHALIATAVGLAAAIPAVMAFNYFNGKVRLLATEMDNFSDDFLNIVKRHFRAR